MWPQARLHRVFSHVAPSQASRLRNMLVLIRKYVSQFFLLFKGGWVFHERNGDIVNPLGGGSKMALNPFYSFGDCKIPPRCLAG